MFLLFNYTILFFFILDFIIFRRIIFYHRKLNNFMISLFRRLLLIPSEFELNNSFYFKDFHFIFCLSRYIYIYIHYKILEISNLFCLYFINLLRIIFLWLFISDLILLWILLLMWKISSDYGTGLICKLKIKVFISLGKLLLTAYLL